MATVTTVGALMLTSGCGQGDSGSTTAKDILLNMGGRIAVLKSIDAEPEIVAERPEGTERLDVYRLADDHQLADGRIAGVQDGSLVTISPHTPERTRLLGPAAAWFPSADNGRAWAVTEEPAATACVGQKLPPSVKGRFTVTEHTTSGSPSRRAFLLPCGVEPIAETSHGLVAHRTTEDAEGTGNGKVARTDIVLLDSKAQSVARVVAQNATVLGAAGSRVVWHQEACQSGSCVKVYVGDDKKSKDAPNCDDGDAVGRGEIDGSGRWYATLVRSGDTYRVAVLDLEAGECQDIANYPSTASHAIDLEGALSATWSQSTLLLLDTESGALTSFDAATGKQEQRKGALDVSKGAQVWGARHE
ncbi:hypothetical protein [Streptomyces ficellus]|uniref:Uncharacterized protein n=1 Tax=Streptomyces ficellus TaxID=1977088 RepID=A0A6I6F646_9ACTN|nr:hypothetical protein [Streptomyces ficellus]QGV79533.1 hypothetical protein EIZ62_15740 [Streptomyces ficellus]